MAFNQGQAVQAAKNHLFLDTLNFANRLSLSEHWLKITTPAPIGLYHLHGKLFAVSAKNTFQKLDLEDSVDLVVQPDAVMGFKKVAGLDTEKNPINAACYLYGGQPGISLSKDDRQEEEEGELKEIIILGGAYGQLLRYENKPGEGWVKTGSLKLSQPITDVLQTTNERVLVVQESGYFDFVDQNNFVSVSHIVLQGLNKINMARIL